MKSTLPIVICIDAEPDDREMRRDEPAEWRGLPATWQFLDRLRTTIGAAGGRPVHYTWFLRMDEQIAEVYGGRGWAAHRYRDLFAAAAAAGDDVGLHAHAWRWSAVDARWFSDFANQPWIEEAVRLGVREFAERFGRPCRSFRFGDRWLNDATVDLLEELGIAFDLTIEPGRRMFADGSLFTGVQSDYSSSPRRPYHPRVGQFLAIDESPSARRLWLMPVSSVNLDQTFGLSLGASAIPKGGGCYEGYLDSADGEWIAGWAYDEERPDEAVDVDVIVNGERAGSVSADLLRPDLAAAEKGNGAHAFRLRTPVAWCDGRARTVSVRVAGTSQDLSGSPVRLVAAAGRSDDFWTLNLFNDSVLFGRAFDELTADPNLPYLGLVLRSDAVLDPAARGHITRNLNHLATHRTAARFVIATPAEAMALVAVDSPDAAERA